MDEGEIACGGFVVSRGEAACVFQPVDAALDPVPQGVDEVVDGDLDFAALAHGNDGNAAAALDVGTHAVGVVAPRLRGGRLLSARRTLGSGALAAITRS